MWTDANASQQESPGLCHLVDAQRLALHGKITVRIGAGATDDSNIDRKGLVEQTLCAPERHELNQVLGGSRIPLAAAVARIDKGADPDLRDVAGTMGSDIAEQMGDDALRQVIRFNPICDCEL